MAELRVGLGAADLAPKRRFMVVGVKTEEQRCLGTECTKVLSALFSDICLLGDQITAKPASILSVSWQRPSPATGMSEKGLFYDTTSSKTSPAEKVSTIENRICETTASLTVEILIADH